MGKISLFVIFILITLAVGFGTGVMVQKQPWVKPPAPSTIPLPPRFLISPLLQTLYANIEGKIISKTADSFIVERDGRQLTLYVEEKTGLTTLEKKSGNIIARIGYNELQIGDSIRGGISVVVNLQQVQGLSRKYQVGELIAHKLTLTSSK